MKLLPPALAGLLIIAMCVLAWILPGPIIIPEPYNLLGLIGLVGGVAISLIAARQFARVGTNIKPFNDPNILVTDGLFAWTRNPMYLGVTVTLIGLAILLGRLWPFLGPIAFAVIADRWYIQFEEQALRRTFGELYEAYARTTRRWI
jgi:protein-S-isoprenylcysteine O-methyltransferase Ste14